MWNWMWNCTSKWSVFECQIDFENKCETEFTIFNQSKIGLECEIECQIYWKNECETVYEIESQTECKAESVTKCVFQSEIESQIPNVKEEV